MIQLINIDILKDQIGEDELMRLAGIGDFRDDDGRTLDDVKISQALAFASDLVGGYLVKRYPSFVDLQIEQVPTVIQGYAADIAHYRLRLKSGDQNDVTKEVRIRNDEALAWLKEVSRGTTNIDFGDALPTSQGASSPTGKVLSNSPAPRTNQTLAGY